MMASNSHGGIEGKMEERVGMITYQTRLETLKMGQREEMACHGGMREK